MTTRDWKLPIRMTLSSMQYPVWLTEYRDLATATTMANLAGIQGIDRNELMGEGQYATPRAQAQLEREAFLQIKDRALQSLHRVPGTGHPETSFATVRQEPREPYLKFTERLQNTLERQVGNEAARQILLCQLAYENASADCQRALAPAKKKPNQKTPKAKKLTTSAQQFAETAHKLAVKHKC